MNNHSAPIKQNIRVPLSSGKTSSHGVDRNGPMCVQIFKAASELLPPDSADALY
jgi:hypothetical protein